MPRRKIRRRRHTDATASPWVRERLLSGHSYGFLAGQVDEDELPDLWSRMREDLLAEYTAAHPYGSRPWAWWAFDALEPRRCLSGAPAAGDLWYGMPAVWTADQFGDPPQYESQAEYLLRTKRVGEDDMISITPVRPYAEILTASDQAALGDGCTFDIRRADRAERFFSRFLRHSQGRFAGQPFELADWQRHGIVRPLFGWLAPDGRRRYRRAFVFVPKKNGKSALASGLVVYGCLDGEPRAEVYGAATDRKQSGIVFDHAQHLVLHSPEIAAVARIQETHKTIRFGDSFYRALSGDAPSSEGMNIYMLVCDELHAWNTPTLRDLWGSLYYGTAARDQPLSIVITTAGEDDPEAIWIEEYNLARSVARGELIDTRLLPFLCEADKNDDWADPETHRRANPSYGTILDPVDMTAECEAAKLSERKKRLFLRYRLNRPTSAIGEWLDADVWRRNGDAPELADGDPCCAGLDMSKRWDFTALVLVGRRPDDAAGDDEEDEARYDLVPYFWMPEETIRLREQQGKLLYRQWAEAGLLEPVPGPAIQNVFIRQRIIEVSRRYELVEVAYDEWKAGELAEALELGEGITMIRMRQGYRSLGEPTAKLETLLRCGKVNHGNHPILSWMFGNTQVLTDENGNIRPVKPDHNSDKCIDGIVAAIMGLARAVYLESRGCVYDDPDRDVIVL